MFRGLVELVWAEVQVCRGGGLVADSDELDSAALEDLRRHLPHFLPLTKHNHQLIRLLPEDPR